MKQDTIISLNTLTKMVQDAIFAFPEIATGVGGWRLQHGTRGPMQCTNQRPDGTVTHRKDKMVLYYRPEGYLYLSYNGSSFRSMSIWNHLRERYHESDFIRLIRILCKEYQINCDLDDTKPVRLKSAIVTPSNMNKTAKPTPSGDEEDAAIIPMTIVTNYIDLHREDQLRNYLNSILDPLVLEGVWHEYGVGIARDGRPIFFYYDRAGRCRNGKIMRYTKDGHRDRKTDGSILAIPSLLQRSGHLPAIATYSGLLFGEHLLAQYSNSPVALVESEKTALVGTAINPEFVWLATGGVNNNNGRPTALLSGRMVTVFPDADATEKWHEKYDSMPGWKISDICYRVAQERGPEWSKCDLADIVIDQCLKERKKAR